MVSRLPILGRISDFQKRMDFWIFGIFGYIFGKKRATGDLLVSKRFFEGFLLLDVGVTGYLLGHSA